MLVKNWRPLSFLITKILVIEKEKNPKAKLVSLSVAGKHGSEKSGLGVGELKRFVLAQKELSVPGESLVVGLEVPKSERHKEKEENWV